MTKIMKTTIAILALAAFGITAANAGIHVGINFGIPAPVLVAPAPVLVPPPMPAPVVEVAPDCPVPGYVWVGGCWGWSDNHWAWNRGHWALPGHWDRDRDDDYFRGEHHEDFHRDFRGEHGRR